MEEAEANEEDADFVYPSGPALWLLTLGLCLTTFVVSIRHVYAFLGDLS